jgi:hypothetical protein
MIAAFDPGLHVIDAEAPVGEHASTVHATVAVALEDGRSPSPMAIVAHHAQPPHAVEPKMSPRQREQILSNLETIYREAYDRCRAVDDKARMLDLDSAFQREQLLLEVLMDIRDALYTAAEGPPSQSALEKLEVLRRLVKLR